VVVGVHQHWYQPSVAVWVERLE